MGAESDTYTNRKWHHPTARLEPATLGNSEDSLRSPALSCAAANKVLTSNLTGHLKSHEEHLIEPNHVCREGPRGASEREDVNGSGGKSS